MLTDILINNGLSKKEADLYLATLQAGEMTISRAAKRSNLKRSTIYGLIESLRNKGVISVTEKKGVRFISALAPQILLEHFKQNLRGAEAALPQLISLAYSSPIKPRIKFYEHSQGIKDILFEAACTKTDYIGVSDFDIMPTDIYAYIRKTVAKERGKRGTHLKLIMPNNQANQEVAADYTDNIHTRIVDFPSHRNHIEILLYSNSKCGFLSYARNEMFGVVIDSEAIYQTLHDLFMVIWNSHKNSVS